MSQKWRGLGVGNASWLLHSIGSPGGLVTIRACGFSSPISCLCGGTGYAETVFNLFYIFYQASKKNRDVDNEIEDESNVWVLWTLDWNSTKGKDERKLKENSTTESWGPNGWRSLSWLESGMLDKTGVDSFSYWWWMMIEEEQGEWWG